MAIPAIKITNGNKADEKTENIFYTMRKSLSSKWNINALTRLNFKATQKPVYDFADKRFEEYRKIVKVTDKEYNSETELKSDTPKADIYMTGSAQVWNTVVCGEIDPVNFLSFLPKEAKKIAYAASFGGASVAEKDKARIKSWLEEYDKVTVRENSGIKIASELGIHAEQVLDPTFLLDKNEWEKLIPNRKCDEKYVLVYQLHPNKQYDAYAKEIAKRKGYKLYRVSHCIHHYVRSGKFICCPPVGEFLWYIKNAEYFLTDSFHGTAFSIGLNTQFADVLPKSYSERISSILELIGYENRILKSYDDFKIAEEKIDFNRVNKIISSERKKSFDILKTMIGD